MNLNRKVTGIEIAVAFFAVALLILFFISGVQSYGNDPVSKGISNCRQIITSMLIYSSDHDGKYPDAALVNPRSSNEVFRVLFRESWMDNEMIFGCPNSPFVPDGKIGIGPDYNEVLQAGENHWAMTAGLSDDASGSIPLVYENPVVATWSPKWNPDAKGTMTRGRAWSTGIIIGMNDRSVARQPLESKTGTAVPLKELGEGVNLFTQHNGSDPSDTFVVLDVEVEE